MPSSGQLSEDEEREPTSTPAIPEEGVYSTKLSTQTGVQRLKSTG
ncbi:MAG: hypothetical protein RXR41_05235 [Candidatus Marsarchaeota archaeon]